MKNKSKTAKKGFTIMELMIVLVIMSLVAIAGTAGIMAISTTYKKIVVQSNAEELSQLLTTTISSELNYADNIIVDGSNNLESFYSAKYRTCNLGLDANGRVVILRDGGATVVPVVPEDNYANGLKVSTLGITYDADMFNVEMIITDASDKEFAHLNYVIKSINY